MIKCIIAWWEKPVKYVKPKNDITIFLR